MNKNLFESIIQGREKLEESYNEDYYGYDISPFRPFTKSDKIDVADLPNGSEPLIFRNDYLLMTIGGITYEETDLCVLEICVDNPGREPEDTTDNFTAYALKAPFDKCLRIGKRISKLESQDEVTRFCSMRGGSIIKVFEGIIRGREKLEEAYKGLDISPFKPFSKEDYYAYAETPKFPNGDEPLIYTTENDFHVIIAPEESGSNICTIDVIFEYEGTAYVKENMSFIKSLKLGMEIVDILNNSSLLEAYNFLEDNGFYEL